MEKLYFIVFVLLTLIVVQNMFINNILNVDSHNNDVTDDILKFFNTKTYLGQTKTNVADVSVILKVYQGEPSCAFLLIDDNFTCFVCGENEPQRKTLLEIISSTINNTEYPEEKIFWIKPNSNTSFEA